MRETLRHLILTLALAAVAAGETDYATQIQPILSEYCYNCHGPDAGSREAGLRLDTKEGAYQVKDGVASIVPGDSKKSEVIRRIMSHDPALMMPPPKSKRTLSDAEKAALTRWVDEGAKWGHHWSFVAPHRPAVPAKTTNPIDAFIQARLRKEGLAPSKEAAPEDLLRRVSLDLTGVPPAPAELDAFIKDPSPQAYEQAVDRLLNSPRYGERMVWEWLDAARYADTNGYQGDPTRAMWYWRDWAIKAFNDNLPYDRFTIEQLAGDLLPNPTQDQLIATGFNRNHMINGEGGRIPEESRVDYVMDRTETTSTVWLGLTMQCSKCHDHKFDPLSQEDYYKFSAFFNSIDETGGKDGGGLANPIMSLATPEACQRAEELTARQAEVEREYDELVKSIDAEQAAWEQSLTDIPAELREALAAPAASRTQQQSETIRDFHRRTAPALSECEKRRNTARAEAKSANDAIPKTMVMRERAQPRETFVLTKGNYENRAQKVSHGVPSILPALPPGAKPDRLAMAKWLMAPEQPLTARVTVNRYWQMLFGTGLVKTVDDFGIQGERPYHPELLDWLAVEFRESGWDVKKMIRLMVTSAAYRQSSVIAPGMAERDPDNRLLSRGPRHRLPSWMLRDQALAISGLLVNKVGGPPVRGYQPSGVWEDATFGQIKYTQQHGEALYRRSLYTFWRRIVAPTMFFDAATRTSCSVKTGITNTPLHALVMLNDITHTEAARALAQRMLKEGGTTDAECITYGFRLCTCRAPSAKDLPIMQSALAQLRKHYSSDHEAARKLIAVGESPRDPAIHPAELAAYTGLASLLLNLDETLCNE